MRVRSKYQLCGIWEREKTSERKLGDSSGHDEFDVSRSARLQSLKRFY